MRFFLYMTENILGVKIQKLFAKKKEQKNLFQDQKLLEPKITPNSSPRCL